MDNKNYLKKLFFVCLIIIINVFFIHIVNNKMSKDDVFISYYIGNDKIDSMPTKDNSEGFVFERGDCDNGPSIFWDENKCALK